MRFIVFVMLAQPTTPPTAIPNQLSKQTPGAPPPGVQMLLVQSVITVGPNRFAFGLSDGGDFIDNAKLTITFFDLTQGTQKEGATLPATFRAGPEGLVGIYTVETNFSKAGTWGARVVGTTSDGNPIDKAISFDVVTNSPELAVSQRAPFAKSLTVRDVNGDLKLLSSAPKPNPGFYQISLDDAIKSGKPTLVLFSTPAFCTSRLCGPVYDVVNEIYPAYGDKMNFIHIEVYKDMPNPNLSQPQYVDSMKTWGLATEPWTYLLDNNGIVFWRAEGLVTTDELKIQLDRMLKSS
jgi:hypothetical protein